MLVEFQQALADLTASPALCIEARRDPAALRQRYRLTEREWRRLSGIVTHPGMECACIVYRANRLAPLALNLPQTCRALGSHLREVVSEYWAEFPHGNVHFFVETDRFCTFLKNKMARPHAFAPVLAPTLEREAAIVAAALRESYTENNLRGAEPLPDNGNGLASDSYAA